MCVCVFVYGMNILIQDFFLFLHYKEPWKCICFYVIPGCDKVAISCLQICNRREKMAVILSRVWYFSHIYACAYNNLYIY